MTPPTPARDTTAGRVYNDLRNLARRHSREPIEYFTLFALEGFLSRLAACKHADDFVLKGGVLMAAFAARRPTRDIDLASSGLANDVHDVERRVREIVAQQLDDGLTFDAESVAGESIRDDADFSGVRVKLVAHLASARVPLHADVNFGDPIWPAPAETQLPRLLGGTLRLRGYPDHMVLAEKIVTAIDRGDQNTRWRDFVDITAIIGARRINGSNLREALRIVADYRHVSLERIAPLLEGMPVLAQRKWAVWRRKQRLEASTPELFHQVLESCVVFADRAIDGSADGKEWDPNQGKWR